MEKFLKIKDITKQTGLSKTTILRLINNGSLEAFRVGNIYVIRESEFERYLASVSSRNADGALRTGVEALIGQTGLVVERISPFTGGRVYLKGELWKAFDSEGGTLEENTPVVIEKIEGVSLYVRRK